MIETPRVWVGCLGCYNGGDLVGTWVDAVDAPEDVSEWFALDGVEPPASHFTEAHEELWVFDLENFGRFLTGETSPSEAKRIAEAMGAIEANHIDLDPFGAWLENESKDLTEDVEDLIQGFEDAYAGEWGSLADYAEEFFEDVYSEALETMPNVLRYHIDWEGVGRDLRLGGDVYEVQAPGGNVWVFRNC